MQTELSDTEDKISYARQFYNDTVTSYNTLLQLFPNVIFANMFGFHDEKLFKARWWDYSDKRFNLKRGKEPQIEALLTIYFINYF